MSNSTQASNIDVSLLQESITGGQIVVAASALCCYEWLVTLDQEFTHIWCRKWKLTTWIFALSRYTTLVYSILQVLPIQNYISCVVLLRLGAVLILLQYLASALFTGLRTSALCNRNLWVFIVVCGLGVVPVVTNMLEYIKGTVVFIALTSVPVDICEERVSLPGQVVFGLSLGVRLAVIAADIIAVIVNWRKAIGTVREASRLNIKVPLSMALIQNGTMLFLGLLGLNILEIVSNTVPNAQIVAPGNSLIAPLSSILLCRFMLNLKQVDGPGQSTGNMSTIHFKSDLLVGNLGESLELGHEADELDLEVSDQIVEERPGDVERPGSSSHSGQ